MGRGQEIGVEVRRVGRRVNESGVEVRRVTEKSGEQLCRGEESDDERATWWCGS